VSIAAIAPTITHLSIYSDYLGVSNRQMIVTGQNLVDVFGSSSVVVSTTPGGTQETGVTASVVTKDANNPGTVTLQYSINAGAALGDHYIAIANSFGKSDPKTFTVVAASSGSGLGPPPLVCAVTSNPQSGYTSIVSTGSPGGSGTMAVSFSGAAYAAISPTVTYGPYSTPSSIASNIAALITKNYLRNGLSAKAYGPNIVYSGNAPLGAVSNVTTGPSITTTTSTASAESAESACDDAAALPKHAIETTVVAWINGTSINLPSGESTALQAVFPPLGPNSTTLAGCGAELLALANGQRLAVSDNATDRAYASAWLLKYSGNNDPGAWIKPSTFTSFNFDYRLFSDYSPGQGTPTAATGYTPDPCGTGIYLQGETYPESGYTGTSRQGFKYLLAETRVGATGQAGWETLHYQQEIPWVWNLIEFNQDGTPANYLNRNSTTCGGSLVSLNYQIFPTYSVYVKRADEIIAMRVTTINQGNYVDFANLPPGQELDFSCIP
jgi:hypothetical protein